MAFVSNPYNFLLEVAQSDLNANTDGYMTETAIRKRLDSIEEVTDEVIISAQMVPVINVNEEFFVEMNSIAGYMKSNDITSVEEALDNISEANQLPQYSVGLLMESDDYIEAMVESAKKKGSKDAKNKILGKIMQSTDLGEKLKASGYTVKKKKKKNKRK